MKDATKPSSTRRSRVRCFVGIVSVLVPAGITYAQGDEKVGEVRQEIRGGEVIRGFTGVVDFGGCTGSMIAPNLVLTAAHCFTPNPQRSSSGTGMFTISYYDPIDGRRPVPVFAGNARWMVPSSYGWGDPEGTGYANDDLGVIQIAGRFTDTSYRDYLRIYDDAADALETSLRAYGAGYYTYSGREDDKLRWSWFEVENVEKNHIVVDTRELVSICNGDSGGPLIYPADANGIEVPTIAGVFSFVDKDLANEGGICSNNDPPYDDAFLSRPHSKRVEWIEAVTGVSCELGTRASKNYRRCFTLPFIEDVEWEGSDRDTAVAIAVAGVL